ncbi:hypothetical protein C8F04DRAFT_1226732 [Mycena alexandri]|uniref:Uncharacterized protein n=1 Tax=Mycena alexandri TaxID=1745969 RepID=A0AAD6TKV1_9AGAR|nr:hypothetical protein C8F04DRAFT_1226732 [Mycena alexandri]
MAHRNLDRLLCYENNRIREAHVAPSVAEWRFISARVRIVQRRACISTFLLISDKGIGLGLARWGGEGANLRTCRPPMLLQNLPPRIAYHRSNSTSPPAKFPIYVVLPGWQPSPPVLRAKGERKSTGSGKVDSWAAVAQADFAVYAALWAPVGSKLAQYIPAADYPSHQHAGNRAPFIDVGQDPILASFGPFDSIGTHSDMASALDAPDAGLVGAFGALASLAQAFNTGKLENLSPMKALVIEYLGASTGPALAGPLPSVRDIWLSRLADVGARERCVLMTCCPSAFGGRRSPEDTRCLVAWGITHGLFDLPRDLANGNTVNGVLWVLFSGFSGPKLLLFTALVHVTNPRWAVNGLALAGSPAWPAAPRRPLVLHRWFSVWLCQRFSSTPTHNAALSALLAEDYLAIIAAWADGPQSMVIGVWFKALNKKYHHPQALPHLAHVRPPVSPSSTHFPYIWEGPIFASRLGSGPEIKKNVFADLGGTTKDCCLEETRRAKLKPKPQEPQVRDVKTSRRFETSSNKTSKPQGTRRQNLKFDKSKLKAIQVFKTPRPPSRFKTPRPQVTRLQSPKPSNYFKPQGPKNLSIHSKLQLKKSGLVLQPCCWAYRARQD